VQPQVVRALFSDDVHDGFSVGRELRVTPDTGIGIKKLHLRLGPGTKRTKTSFPTGILGSSLAAKNTRSLPSVRVPAPVRRKACRTERCPAPAREFHVNGHSEKL